MAEVANEYQYDAFGNTVAISESIKNRFRYAGEQYDTVTSQYYLRARYYNPVIGRFTQQDTYLGAGLNLYAYCNNNPLSYIDPSGHNPTSAADHPQLPAVIDTTPQLPAVIDNSPQLPMVIDQPGTLLPVPVETSGNTASASSPSSQTTALVVVPPMGSYPIVPYSNPSTSNPLTAAQSADVSSAVSDAGGSINPQGVTYEGPLYRNVGTMPDGTPVNPLEISDFTNRQNYRYTQNGQNGIYFASSQHVMEGEMGAYNSNPYADNRTTYHYDTVQLNNMLDLTNPDTRRSLGVELSDLISSDYRNYTSTEPSPAVTHAMGNFAAQNGYTGLIVPSARADGGVNVVIFNPNEIDFGTYTTIHDRN